MQPECGRITHRVPLVKAHDVSVVEAIERGHAKRRPDL